MMPPFGSLLEPHAGLRAAQSPFYIKNEPIEFPRRPGMDIRPSKSGKQQSAFSKYHDTHAPRRPLQHEFSAFGPFSATTQSYDVLPMVTRIGAPQASKGSVQASAQSVASRPSYGEIQVVESATCREVRPFMQVQPVPAETHRGQVRQPSLLLPKQQPTADISQQFQEILRTANAMFSKSDGASNGTNLSGIRDTTSDGFLANSVQAKCKQESDIASSSFSAPLPTRKRSHSELAEESCDSELVLGIGGRSSREGSEYRSSRASSPSKSQKRDTRSDLVSADLSLAPPVVAAPEYSSSSSHEEHPSDMAKVSEVCQSHGVAVSPTESLLSFQKNKSQTHSRVDGVTSVSQSESQATGFRYQQPVRPLLNLDVIKLECEAVQRERSINEDSRSRSETHGIELGLFPKTVQLGQEGKKSEASGSQLVHLLLRCADATSKDKIETAAQMLDELYSHASLFGDSMQRIAAYFTEGLAARIVGKDNPIYKAFMYQSRLDDYLSAFTTLYKVCPYFQFGHFTANQAILEAFEGRSVVHVIDLDLMQGFQWPGLIQSLSERPDGPPKLKITGIGTSCTSLHDTGRRLASFAESFGVPFEFHAVVGELEDLTAMELGTQPGEAVAVNCVMQLHRLLNHPTGDKLQGFINGLRRMKPVVLTLVEQEASHNANTFLARFVEALHYYAAVFDSLDSALPLASDDRVKIEQMYFAQQIKNIVACEGVDRIERHENLEVWQQRMQFAGFRPLALSSHAVTQAKLLLSLSPCDGYRLTERPGGCVSLGWQDRNLLSASTWVL